MAGALTPPRSTGAWAIIGGGEGELGTRLETSKLENEEEGPKSGEGETETSWLNRLIGPEGGGGLEEDGWGGKGGG